jgi:hypothetical protein
MPCPEYAADIPQERIEAWLTEQAHHAEPHLGRWRCCEALCGGGAVHGAVLHCLPVPASGDPYFVELLLLFCCITDLT